MNRITRSLPFFILVILLINSCKKKDTNNCNGQVQLTAQFAVREMVGDTAFDADTIFHDNIVQFISLFSYDNVNWKIGDDPRSFTQPLFTLNFVNDLISIPITFTGNKAPNTACFPNDNGVYIGTKPLTTVEQFDRNTLTVSPLVGEYRGFMDDNPSDVFTVRIDYFDSAKYNTAITGIRNFYWISNLPNGFVGTTASSLNYPELAHGQSMEMGYKSFVFGTSTCEQGQGWLSNDSLYVNVGSQNCNKKFIGKRL